MRIPRRLEILGGLPAQTPDFAIDAPDERGERETGHYQDR